MQLVLWLVVSSVVHAIHALDPKYQVRYIDSDIPAKTAKGLLLQNTIQENGYFEVFNINRDTIDQNYLCYVPPVSMNTTGVTTGIEHKDINTDIMLEQALPILAKTFNTSECLLNFKLNGGYWTIGYCFGDKVIQFHEDPVHFMATGEHKLEFPNFIYTLGRFPKSPSSTSKVFVENGIKGGEVTLEKDDFSIQDDPSVPLRRRTQSQKVLLQTLKNGGICDLTNEPRTIDVIYKCDPKLTPGIAELVEYKTCHYQMVIVLTSMCHVDGFKPIPLDDVVIPIDCRSIKGDVENSPSSDVSVLDFYLQPDTPSTSLIKVRKKISLADYALLAIGSGVFSGQLKDRGWLDSREILVSTKDLGSDREIIELGGIIYSNLLDQNEDSPGKVIKWKDTFVIWVELYDFYGDLRALLRIERKDRKEKILSIQAVDPDNLLDQDGDAVDITLPIFEDEAGNFESLTQAGFPKVEKFVETTEEPSPRKSLFDEIGKTLQGKSAEDLELLLLALKAVEEVIEEDREVEIPDEGFETSTSTFYRTITLGSSAQEKETGGTFETVGAVESVEKEESEAVETSPDEGSQATLPDHDDSKENSNAEEGSHATLETFKNLDSDILESEPLPEAELTTTLENELPIQEPIPTGQQNFRIPAEHDEL